MLLRALADTLFPPLCHGCKVFLDDPGELHLCQACRAGITLVESPLCSCCGVPFVTEGGGDHRCGPCTSETPRFELARAVAVYDGIMRDLIHRFKYGDTVRLARPLALLTAERLLPTVSEFAPDLVLPVPLHARRLRERGFNQSLLLAEKLAKLWQLPLERSLLQRTRWTEPQTALSADERRRNLRNAFAVEDTASILGRKVLLVDDVYTTGSTLNECSLTLKGGGAAAVFAVAVARAPLAS